MDHQREPELRVAVVAPPNTSAVSDAAGDAMPPLEPGREISLSRGTLRDLIRSALDALDDVGDSIAGVVGLR